MRVLVTGGTGFIGRRLVSKLTSRGDEVVVLSRKPPQAPPYHKLKALFLRLRHQFLSS